MAGGAGKQKSQRTNEASHFSLLRQTKQIYLAYPSEVNFVFSDRNAGLEIQPNA